MPKAPLNIGYFGLPLGALLLGLDGHSLNWLVLSPVDAPGQRRLRRRFPDAVLCDIRQSGTEWKSSVHSIVGTIPVDLVVSWFWTRQVDPTWLARVRYGGIGAHPSLLPRHRGPNPYFAAIDAGDDWTGVTVHRLDQGYDQGDILAQEAIPVAGRDAWQLARALDGPSLNLLRQMVLNIANGKLPSGVMQHQPAATFAPEPDGPDLRVDWTWTTERLLRRVRALCPVPGLALELSGQKFLVTRAAATTRYPKGLFPGEAWLDQLLVLRTGDGAIQIERAAMSPEPGPTDELELCTGERLVERLSMSNVMLAHPGGIE